jgi:hypothetical protein
VSETPLDRLLWRYEYGRLAPELFEIELRGSIDWLGESALDLYENAPAVRLWNSDLLASRSAAFQAAVHAIDTQHYRDAVRRIHDCERLTTTMRDLLDAVEAADRAEAGITALHELAAAPRLRRLPVVASLAQMVDLARQQIIEERFVRAAGIARICIRIAAPLGEPQLDAPQPDALLERLRAAEDLCDGARPFTPSVDDDPTTDGTFAALRRLIEDRYICLALRLLAEFEIQLGPRRRFMLLHERTARDAAVLFGPPEEVRAAIRDRSWDGAVDHYWHLSLAAHADAISKQRQRTGAAAAAIDTALQPLAES